MEKQAHPLKVLWSPDVYLRNCPSLLIMNMSIHYVNCQCPSGLKYSTRVFQVFFLSILSQEWLKHFHLTMNYIKIIFFNLMISVKLFHYATQMSVLHEDFVILVDKICSNYLNYYAQHTY